MPNQSYDPEFLRRILQRNANLNFVQRLQEPWLYPRIENPDGSYSTHLMASGEGENGMSYVFPTIVQLPDKSLMKLSGADAFHYALQNQQAIAMRDAALADALGTNYKLAFPPGWSSR